MGDIFSTIRKQRKITTRAQLDEEIYLFRQDQLISSFLEVAVGQTTETARRLLQRTNWNIEEAINLFLTNDYDSSMHHETQVDDSATSSSGTSDDSPSSFEEAKAVSVDANLWLIVNLKSRKESASTSSNDVWSNDVVSQTVKHNFFLWHVYDQTIEGQKISSFYKIDSDLPVVLLIDPITGQKMHMWSGVIEAQSFVEDLMNFMNAGPHEHVDSLIRNRHPETTETYSSSNNTYQPPAPSWGEEFETEDSYWSHNNTKQVVAPSWGEEFEKEDTYWSHNNTKQVVAPSWGEEFEKEDTYWSHNNTNQVVDPSWGEEFEKVETCSSSNSTDQIVPSYLFAEEIFSEFPVLTEEPKGDYDRSTVCSLCVRFPDGRRKQRKFLKSEPVQLLWSFCYSHMEEPFEKRVFKLVQAIPGSSKTLDFEANATFDQSELANSLISVVWE